VKPKFEDHHHEAHQIDPSLLGNFSISYFHHFEIFHFHHLVISTSTFYHVLVREMVELLFSTFPLFSLFHFHHLELKYVIFFYFQVAHSLVC